MMIAQSKTSQCDIENSRILAQDTVGIAGDDIMYRILVVINH